MKNRSDADARAASLPRIVEGGRKPERVALVERTKAGVEVVEALVPQPQRDDVCPEDVRHDRVRSRAAAEAISGPREPTPRVPNNVARALEGDVVGEVIRYAPAVFMEPPNERWDFPSP